MCKKHNFKQYDKKTTSDARRMVITRYEACISCHLPRVVTETYPANYA